MSAYLQKILAVLDKILRIETQEDLEALEHELFGRKRGHMTLAMKELKDIPLEERKGQAKTLNELKERCQAELTKKGQELKVTITEDLAKDCLDVTLNIPQHEQGYLHLIPEFIAHVEEVFGRMGFDTAYGPEIETEETNFDLLNFAQEHSARDAQDIFYVSGERLAVSGKPLLRAHTSPVQLHYMKSHKPPFRMICPGKVYRRDADATHSPMFHQFEGLMIGENVTLANLKAVLVTALRELIGRDVECRFRTGYFPFVEPGLEMDMMWQGDLEDSREGKWLEMGGCGMVHPNVLKNVGIDPKKWQGFAFGFGVERPLMIKHQIPDIRLFFEGDLRFLKQF